MTERWLPELPDNLLVGASGFAYDDWDGVFYPRGLPPADRLGFYARQFPTLEIDSTFYRIPSPRTVSGWAAQLPAGYPVSLKVPREITHEAALVGTDAATAAFLQALEPLGDRRGPLLLQFPYVAREREPAEYKSGRRFRRRLGAWLERWSTAAAWVVEVRNAGWVDEPLLELLRAHGVPLALTAYYTMPPLARYQRRGLDPLTGPFAYVRFLGEPRQIEQAAAEKIAAGERSRRFESLLWDKERDLRDWVDALFEVVCRLRVYVYFNNHYAGFSPGSAALFARLWRRIHDLE